MDSPSYIHSISSFYSTNISPTSPSSFYPSYIPSFYPTDPTITTPSPTSNLSFINSYSPPPTSYYNSNGSENTEHLGYYHRSNYPVSPYPQIHNTSYEPFSTTYTLPQKREAAHIIKYLLKWRFRDGTDDGYWWIICVERYFKVRGTPKAKKVSEAVTTLYDSTLQWWLERQHHSNVTWESFTDVFLWWFKLEYRDVLPLLEDGKENLNNNEPLCSSFQAHTTLAHESKEQDEPVAEAEVFSTRTSMVLKDSDKDNKLFSDKVSLSSSCDIAIPSLCDVKFFCGEPPPLPKPSDTINDVSILNLAESVQSDENFRRRNRGCVIGLRH